MKIYFLTFLSLILGIPISKAESKDHPYPYAKLELTSNGHSLYVAELLEIDKLGNKAIRIQCRIGCKSKLFYQDEGYEPIGFSPIGDWWPAFIAVTWATGSAYVMSVYRVSEERISKVRSFSSFSVPFFGVNDRGKFVVTYLGPDRFHAKWTTYYLTDHGVVRVPGFVKQR